MTTSESDPLTQPGTRLSPILPHRIAPHLDAVGIVNHCVSLRRQGSVCATVIAGGESMPAPARAKQTPNESVSLEERIQKRAYELYVSRGNQSGSELDDWLQAEDEIQRAEEQALDEH
jgi:hypothetical protein